MTFLIVEMVLYLLGAALLGLGLGWVLRSLGLKDKIERLENRWNRRLRVADDELTTALEKLSVAQGEIEQKNESLKLASRKELAFVAQVGEQERLLSDLREQFDTATRSAEEATRRQREEREVVRAEFEVALSRVGELERAAAAAAERESALGENLDLARKTHDELEGQLAEMRTQLDASLARATSESERGRRLQTELSELQRSVIELRVERDALATAREAQSAAAVEKDKEIAELKSLLSSRAAELANITSQSRSTDSMLAMLEEQLLNRDSDMSALRMELTASERTVASLESSNKHVRQVADDLEQKLKRRDADIEIIRSDLSGRVDAIRALETKTHDLERTCAALVDKSETIEDERIKLQRELAHRNDELQRMMADVGEGETLVEALKRRLAQSEDRISRLELELLTARQTRDDPAVAGLQRPPGLLSEPDGEIDDLTLIRGVGPVLERMLHDLGVFHFRQIAGFSQQDVQWIAGNLDAFSDRVLRDDWIAQAAHLVEQAGSEPGPG